MGLHHKPIGLLNINGFYDHLIAMLDEMVNRGFLSAKNRQLLIVDDEVDGLLDKMKYFTPDFTSKFLKPENT